ncbi:hypothetical protein [Streptomyces sp. NPDC047108]|uniref:hypothetical protein n=1 Tax=Streptomyces sp. NPDC047108 TaxID=3155025 RepID=UPI0033C89941
MRRTTRGTEVPVRHRVRDAAPVRERRQERPQGGRRAAVASSAAVLCLGALLTGCGSGGGDDGYVAVGAVGPDGHRGAGKAVPPEGEVSLTPLDRPKPGARQQGDDASGSGREDATGSAGTADSAKDGSGDAAEGKGDAPSGNRPAGDRPGGSGGPGGSGDGPEEGGDPPTDGSGSGGGSTDPGSPSGEPDPEPQEPAELSVGPIERTATDKRWCEKVTLELRNTGDKAVTSGTVTFATHIIGGLGVDWATIESEQKLPGTVEGGERTEETWTVCVDAWRVPLGMHIETQDVDVDWK